MEHPIKPDNSSDRLVVLWTSGDVYVAERMVLMYTQAACSKKFFNEVILIIWGPSAKLAAENIRIQEKLKAIQAEGVIIQACITCAREYEVADELINLGFDVKAMGQPLTDYLKQNAKILSF
jgi:hypothetical protein